MHDAQSDPFRTQRSPDTRPTRRACRPWAEGIGHATTRGECRSTPVQVSERLWRALARCAAPDLPDRSRPPRRTGEQALATPHFWVPPTRPGSGGTSTRGGATPGPRQLPGKAPGDKPGRILQQRSSQVAFLLNALFLVIMRLATIFGAAPGAETLVASRVRRWELSPALWQLAFGPP